MNYYRLYRIMPQQPVFCVCHNSVFFQSDKHNLQFMVSVVFDVAWMNINPLRSTGFVVFFFAYWKYWFKKCSFCLFYCCIFNWYVKILYVFYKIIVDLHQQFEWSPQRWSIIWRMILLQFMWKKPIIYFFFLPNLCLLVTNLNFILSG